MTTLAPVPEVTSFGGTAAGIHRLSLWTPFGFRVNTYVIDDDPLTLFDTGPRADRVIDELEYGLAALGRQLDNIERIVVSHHHMDHLGNVAQIAARSGAEVVALDGLADWMPRYEEQSAADDNHFSSILMRQGYSADLLEQIGQKALWYRRWGTASDADVRLVDGDRLHFAGRVLRAFHRPGHSSTDTIFVDEHRGLMFGADHLIANVSSNPLLCRPAPDGARARPLIDYRRSLRATRELELQLVLPGHGDVIVDHRALVDRRLVEHEERAEELERLLRGDRALSGCDLVRAMWGAPDPQQLYLPLSEVLGHMDLLLDRGSVAETVDDEGVVRYAAI